MDLEKLETGIVALDDIHIGIDNHNVLGENWHFHPHWELKVYEIDAGKPQVVITPQEEVHREIAPENLVKGWVLNCGKPMLNLHLFSRSFKIKDYFFEWDAVEAICPGGFLELLESIVNAKKRNADARLLNGLLETLWAIIFEVWQKSQNQPVKKSSMVHLAKYYIERHYDLPSLSVESVAAHFGITAGHLVNLFKKDGVTTAHQYIIKIRMSHALLLLRSGRYMVKEVADMTGWSCPFYFSNCFHRYFGVSPSKATSIPDDVASIK